MLEDLKKKKKKSNVFTFIPKEENAKKLVMLSKKGYKMTDIINDALVNYFNQNFVEG